MEVIGMFDAKTRFSELVDQVHQTGQPITITNRGKPVAEIVPVRKSETGQITQEEAFDLVARLWETVEPMTQQEIQQTIEEGRDRCLDV